jgi:hypothetical protein
VGELSEERLLELVHATLAEADPVPEALVEAARQAFSWRTFDTELAELLLDSAEWVSAARADRGPRLVTFALEGLEIDLEIADEGARRCLLGQLVPPQFGEIDVRQTVGVVTVEAGETGRFELSDLSAGPVSLVCHLPTRPKPVVTEWLSI